MLKLPYPLAEIDSKVLESDAHRRVWIHGDPTTGVVVEEKRRRLDELAISFYFVLPHLTSADDAVSLLTVARGRPGDSERMPSFFDPVELRDVHGGVYAHVGYDPARERFEVTMNVGSESRELLGVTLEDAPPELYCGRVLECYVEVSEGRIFASVNDRFAGGELALDDVAASTGEPGRPWGTSPAGHWWVLVGVGDPWAGPSAALVPGVGISNLRVTLGSDVEEAVGSLLYRGELDRLAASVPPRVTQQEIRALLAHVGTLRAMAKDFERLGLLLPVCRSSEGETVTVSAVDPVS